MAFCPKCGGENREDARFCIHCGASLAPAAETPPTPPETSSVQAPAPPPGAPVPPAVQAPPPPGGRTTAPAPPASPAAPYAAAAPGAAHRMGVLFWMGSLLVLAAGVVILLSTFMTWGSGPFGRLSLTGWDWYDLGRTLPAGSGEVSNAFFVYSQGKPIFTGLCTLIAGGILALVGLLMLIFRSKGMGGVAILFSIFCLGMAVANTYTVVSSANVNMGVGMYLFLAFSVIGLVAAPLAMSG